MANPILEIIGKIATMEPAAAEPAAAGTLKPTSQAGMRAGESAPPEANSGQGDSPISEKDAARIPVGIALTYP
jgi:hypothetical protein